jgi:predicted AAA+ superfamily ATPase
MEHAMPLIQRTLKTTIQKYLFKGRIILVYGARRVGKTTLVQQLLEEYPGNDKRYINCDLESQRRNLEVQEAETLKAFLGNNKLVVLDEAQNIQEVGRVLKILVDTYPEMQIIATGSSAFDLANKTAESMTGRVYPFTLYPLSIQEIAGDQGLSVVEPHLEQILRFGLYPDIFGEPEQEARFKLDELVSNYLFKDILIYAGLKRASTIRNLLRLLAHQIGREVSYTELGQQLGIDRKTVLSYIDLLEQCFIIFRLGAFSRNLRKEISKSDKVYFYDLGVRNTLIDA